MESENHAPWHQRSREQSHRVFHLQPSEQPDYPRRSDIFLGYTVIPDLWEEYHSSREVCSEDFSSSGEVFCYLKIDGINGLQGSVFLDKSQIEDTLDEALRSFAVGCVVGGGTGLRYSYVDFAVVDVPIASAIIRKVLCAGGIPRRSWILFFDFDRRDDWIGVWDDTPRPP
jgi:hypothetical protein